MRLLWWEKKNWWGCDVLFCFHGCQQCCQFLLYLQPDWGHKISVFKDTPLENSNHEVSPHLFWFRVVRCLQNSEKAVHGMVWILSGPGYVGHHMKSYMKYTLKNSLLSCTVTQKWSFSVMKFMLKCLRSCPSKIIESGRVVIYAAHYTCSNVDLNLILVVARTSGFISQIIDSLMASRGVHLTWRDCIPKR